MTAAVTAARGLAIPSTPDLDLTGTVAGGAEELGYATVWTNDAPPGDGIASALAMLGATEQIRVGVGAVPCDRRSVRDIAGRLAGGDMSLDRLVLVVGSGGSGTLASVRAAVGELRAALGPLPMIGVAALGERMCRLGGEIADLVLLNWMSPERIRWAREQIRLGAAERADGLRRPEPEVASYVRVSLGQGAALRIGAEAGRYAAIPQYARNFAAMGVASVGIAAPDPKAGPALVEPYDAVLDETVLRVIVSMPDSADSDFGAAFEALGVVMEVAGLFAPGGPEASPEG